MNGSKMVVSPIHLEDQPRRISGDFRRRSRGFTQSIFKFRAIHIQWCGDSRYECVDRDSAFGVAFPDPRGNAVQFDNFRGWFNGDFHKCLLNLNSAAHLNSDANPELEQPQ